jgi:hypothetical protein
MNAITEVPAVSAQTLETVLGTGDLSKLSTQQRVEYYAKTCQSLGLNPLTRPFRFLALNGQIQLYATRDCTDQLRKVHGITLHVVDKQIDGDLFIVTVRARTKDGREDEDIGAVTLGQLRGESRANALMKTMTKAKRRVTLSVCGLGLTDEAELDTLPGAQVFDADHEPPVVPMRAAAASMPRAERVADPTVYDPPPQPERRSWAQWAESMEIAARDAAPEELGNLLAKAEVTEIVRLAGMGEPHPTKARIIAAYRTIEERYLADPPDPPGESARDQQADAAWPGEEPAEMENASG